MRGMGGGMRTLSKRKSDENFKTCSLKSLGSPVPSTEQFFRREIASFLFAVLSRKKANILWLSELTAKRTRFLQATN